MAQKNRVLVMAVAAVCAGIVEAQPVDGSSGEDRVLEEVVVTGSRIKRQDATSLSPLVTLDAEQITFSGITAAEDLVNDAPQLVPYYNRASNNPGAGAAQLNLRGLGPNRTLVTLNGRRMAPADEFGAADINTIPSQLIERVEIVTGGASTVYGSDAVAGVVNFILDDDFEGLEITAQYDVFEEGDGSVADLSAVFGFGNDRGHLTGFVNYQDRADVLAGDREFSAVRLQEAFFGPAAGTLVPAGSGTTPSGTIRFPPAPLPGSPQPGQVTFNADGSPRPVAQGFGDYNFQPANYLQTPLRRDSAALFGSYQFTDVLRAFAEVLYSRTQASQQLAPPPAFVTARVNLDNPLLTAEQRQLFSSAYDPDGDGFAEFLFGRRLEETGPRQSTRDADTLRVVLGLEGELGAGWDWQATYSDSEVDGRFIVGNAVFAERFTQGLLADPDTGACVDPSNGCVPFNPFGLQIPEDAAAFLRVGDITDKYSLEEQIATLVVTGDLIELPAGPLSIAAGLEWRELSTTSIPSPIFQEAGVLGALAVSPVSGTTDVAEVFVEALVPLVSGAPFADYLGIEAGYRYSDYKFSGVADNWKAGIDWAPIPSLRFRMMGQRAIRAPNIDELFRVPTEQPSSLFDPREDQCSASQDPAANGLADLCVAQGIPADQIGVYEAQENFPLLEIRNGGNTALDTETADTLTAGVVIQPERFDGLFLSLDYYRIEIDNAIGSTSLDSALALCFDSRDPASQFCQPVVRAPSGDIAQYTNPQFNLAQLAVEGIDFAANYRWDLGDTLALPGHSAQLAVQVLLNYAMENTLQPTPEAVSIDCAGFFGGACAFGGTLRQTVPEYRSSTRFIYYSGPLSIGLNWRWIGELDSQLDIACVDTPQFCYDSELEKVDSKHYFELSGRFEVGERGEVYAGVSNLFEEDPPLMGFGAQQSNTAPQLYDVFGRRYFLGLRFRL